MLVGGNGLADVWQRNCCFDIPFHSTFLDLAQINILPYLLLPICGPEEFSEEVTILSHFWW